MFYLSHSLYVNLTTSWGNWYGPVIPALEKPRKEDCGVRLDHEEALSQPAQHSEAVSKTECLSAEELAGLSHAGKSGLMTTHLQQPYD